jgi:hypothetical protein
MRLPQNTDRLHAVQVVPRGLGRLPPAGYERADAGEGREGCFGADAAGWEQLTQS